MPRRDAAKKAVKTDKNPRNTELIFSEVALTNPRRLFRNGITQYNPSVLVTRKGLKVFDDMRKDDQIKACMMLKKQGILSTPYTLDLPPDIPQTQAETWEPKLFIDWVFNNMTGTLFDALLNVLTSLDYGYSVSEKVYKIVSTPWGERIAVDRLKVKSPHYFNFECDEYGELKTLKQITSMYASDAADSPPLPIGKFVIMTHSKEWGNWYGTSDLEAAYRPWLIKDNAYKWYAMFLERRGIPPIFILYDAHMQPQLVESLKDVLKNMQANTMGMIPNLYNAKGEGTTNFWSPDADGSKAAREVFTAAFKQFNTDIARALLMPGLLGITPDEKEGSYARSRIHFDVFLMSIDYLRGVLADSVVQEQIIRPLIDLNYPGLNKYPIFGWEPLTQEVKTGLLETWAKLIKEGAVTKAAEDEIHIREELGFPDAIIEEESKPKEDDKKGKDGEDEGKEDEDKEEDYATFAATITERIDFAGIEKRLDGLESEARSRIVEILIGTRDALKSIVRRNPTQISNYAKELRLKGMDDIAEALREFMRHGYEMGRKDAQAMMPKAEMAAGRFTPQEALRYLTQKAFFIKGVLKDKLVADAQQVLLQAIATGELPDETISKLHNIFEPYVGDPAVIVDGRVMEPWRLETILRTNATDAYNQGILAETRLIADLVNGMLYSAILDTRTSDICRGLHGRVFRMDDPALSQFAPPNHYNCRSMLVPVPLSVQVDSGDYITGEEKGRAADLMLIGFGGNVERVR